jgi:hypothetical protein
MRDALGASGASARRRVTVRNPIRGRGKIHMDIYTGMQIVVCLSARQLCTCKCALWRISARAFLHGEGAQRTNA